MKKIIYLLAVLLCFSFFTNQAAAQSTIVIDNTDAKPVPVRMTAPVTVAGNRERIPFTELSKVVSGVATLVVRGPDSTNQYKVLEYLLGSGLSANTITLNYRNVNIPLYLNTSTAGTGQNSYSGMLNIVLQKNDSVVFKINGGPPQQMLVSGYVLK